MLARWRSNPDIAVGLVANQRARLKHQFENPSKCDRANFDSLLWAIVTVFQILTQEDWNLVLYNGMASSGPLASLYFIALMTIGNYVLFNLLVAILVEGFQAEV